MKIGIIGYRGKMGQAILSEVVHHSDISIAILHSRQNNVYQGIEVTSSINELIKKSDIVIDFSHPETSLQVMELSVKHNVGVVSGTTGFNIEEIDQIKKYASKTKIFYSANMSLGIAVLSQAMELIINGLIKNGLSPDLAIIEKHHKHKIDKPSGTAKALSNILQERFNQTPDIVSLRYGSNIGEHQLIISTDMETITLKHQASDRCVYAAGALTAAKFLYNQKENGLYSMNDIIK